MEPSAPAEVWASLIVCSISGLTTVESVNLNQGGQLRASASQNTLALNGCSISQFFPKIGCMLLTIKLKGIAMTSAQAGVARGEIGMGETM